MEYDLDFQDQPKPRKVLIVEDQIADQVLAENRIKGLWPDSNITIVKSLQQCYKECSKNTFDLILLDLNLPDGFGPNSVQEIRRFDRNVPIVVVTGMLTDTTTYEALKKGANDILSKKEMMDDDGFYKILRQNAN